MNPFSDPRLSAPLSPSRNDLITNPSPFKIFKTQSNPLTSAHAIPAVFPTSTQILSNPAQTVPNLASSAANTSSSVFATTSSNPTGASSSKPSDPAPLTLSEIENKLNSTLNQKRIQDVLDDWKENMQSNLDSFSILTKDIHVLEADMRECQNYINQIVELHLKIKKEHQIDSESLDFIESELQQMNLAITSIDKSFDRMFQGGGFMQTDKDNIYVACFGLSKGVFDIEKDFARKFKELDERLESEQEGDIDNFLENCFDNLDWIEKKSLDNAKLLDEIKIKYGLLI